MNKEEFGGVIVYLNSAYDEQPDKAKMSVYFDLLGIYDLDKAMKAVKAWVTRSPFYPKVSDIINLIREGDGVSLNLVMKELHSVISLGAGQSFSSKSLNPVTAIILKELGGKANIGSMSEDKLKKEVNMKFKYVANEVINGGGQISTGTQTGLSFQTLREVGKQ